MTTTARSASDTADAARPCLSAEAMGRELRKAMGRFATGVTVITAQPEGGARVGLTANSFASVSLDPPLVSWSLSLNAPSLDAFRRAGHFAVHVLREDQQALAMQFARPADDKFQDLEPRAGCVGAPVLPGCLALFECEIAFTYYGGDHVIFLGRVVNIETDDGAPLLFVNGRFATL